MPPSRTSSGNNSEKRKFRSKRNGSSTAKPLHGNGENQPAGNGTATVAVLDSSHFPEGNSTISNDISNQDFDSLNRVKISDSAAGGTSTASSSAGLAPGGTTVVPAVQQRFRALNALLSRQQSEDTPDLQKQVLRLIQGTFDGIAQRLLDLEIQSSAIASQEKVLLERALTDIQIAELEQYLKKPMGSRDDNDIQVIETIRGAVIEGLGKQLERFFAIPEDRLTEADAREIMVVKRKLERVALRELAEVREALNLNRTQNLEDQEQQIKIFLINHFQEAIDELRAKDSLSTEDQQLLLVKMRDLDNLVFGPLENMLTLPGNDIDRRVVHIERLFIRNVLPGGSPVTPPQQQRLRTIDERIFNLDYGTLPADQKGEVELRKALREKRVELARLEKRSIDERVRVLREIEVLTEQSVDVDLEASVQRRRMRINELEGQLLSRPDPVIEAELAMLKEMNGTVEESFDELSGQKERREARRIVNLNREDNLSEAREALRLQIRDLLDLETTRTAQLGRLIKQFNALQL